MKKIITILFIIMLIITISQIRNTLALYKAEFSGEVSSKLGVWSIIVNETDITSEGTDMTFEITDDYLSFEDSDNTSGTGIVPGCVAFFDIVLDTTKTDVSVKYNVQIDDVTKLKIGEETIELSNPIEIELLNVEDIFEKEEEIDTTTEHINLLDLPNNQVAGVIPLSVSQEGFKGRVRVKFKWVDNGLNNELETLLANPELGTKMGFTTGNNTVDSILLAGETKPDIVIPVRLNVLQYLGEELDGADFVTTLEMATNNNIGDYIDLGNNIIGTSATTDDWRILYVEENTVHAILADYLPNSTNYASNAGLQTSDTYSVYSNVSREELVTKLTTTSNWNGLANGISGATVTGSPTAELLMNSYNTKNGTELEYTDWISLDSSTTFYDLYIPHTSVIDDYYGYWLASPYADSSNGMWYVYYDGTVVISYCSNTHVGGRPVVALPRNTAITKDGNVWKIIKP